MNHPYLIFTDNSETVSVAVTRLDASQLDIFIKMSKFQKGHVTMFELRDDDSIESLTQELIAVFDSYKDCAVDDIPRLQK